MKKESDSEDSEEVSNKSTKDAFDVSDRKVFCGGKVKKENFSYNEKDTNVLNPQLFLWRCFVNLHNGTNLKNIDTCPKCPRSFSKNADFFSVKKEPKDDDTSLHLKEKNSVSFTSDESNNTCEFPTVKRAKVSRRHCIDIIELSSDSDENECEFSDANCKLENQATFSYEEYYEYVDQINLKTEIQEEGNEEEKFNSSKNSVNKVSFIKEEFQESDETNSGYDTTEAFIKQDLESSNPLLTSAFHTEEYLDEKCGTISDIVTNDKKIEENNNEDQSKDNFWLSNEEIPSEEENGAIFKTKTQNEFEEKINKGSRDNMLNNEKKLEKLKRYCNTDFECKKCGKRFARKFFYMSHIRVAHDSSNKPYICKECGKSFKYNQSRRQHYFNDHKNMKTFKCEDCGKQFLTKGWYQRHSCIMKKLKN